MNTPSVQSLVSKYLSPIKGTRGELKEVNSRAGTGKVYMRLEHLVMSENMELLKKEVGGRLDFGLFPMKSNYCTRERRRQKEYPMTRKAHCGGDGYCLPHRLAIAPLSFQPVTLANNFSFL